MGKSNKKQNGSSTKERFFRKLFINNNCMEEVLKDEIDCIDKTFKNEIAEWNQPAKLIILAECPLECDSYFYNRPHQFLSLLFKQHCKIPDNENIVTYLRANGILVLDIYKYPLPSCCYREDTKNILYDDSYINNKIIDLRNRGIINDNTKFVFRYKRLINKKLYNKPALKNLNYCLVNNTHEPLGIDANAAKLNYSLVKLGCICKNIPNKKVI